MTFLVHFLATSGAQLLVGTTVVMGIACFANWLHRSPIHRQKTGELGILAAVCWLALPMVPRPDWKDTLSRCGSQPDARRGTVAAPSARFLGMARVKTPLSVEPMSAPQKSLAGLPPRADARLARVPVPVVRAEVAARDPMAAGEDHSGRASLTTDSLTGGFATGSGAQHAYAPPALAPTARLQSALASIRSQLAGSVSEEVVLWYLIGVVLAGGWLLFGTALLHRLIHGGVPPHPWLVALLQSLCCEHGRPPRLIISAASRRVISFGILNPTIVVPQRLATRQNRSQLRHVLLHELGHIHQRDSIGQGIVNLGFLLLFFHPLYWCLRAQIHFNRELVIDDWAASRSEKPAYIADLVALAKSHIGVETSSMLSLGVIDVRGSTFYRRIKMLVQRQHSLSTKCSRRWIATHCSLAILVIVTLLAVIGAPTAIGQTTVSQEDSAAKIARLEAERDELTARLRKMELQLAKFKSMLTKADTGMNRDKGSAEEMRAKQMAAHEQQQTAIAAQRQVAQQQFAQAEKQRQEQIEKAQVEQQREHQRAAEAHSFTQQARNYEQRIAELVNEYEHRVADLSAKVGALEVAARPAASPRSQPAAASPTPKAAATPASPTADSQFSALAARPPSPAATASPQTNLIGLANSYADALTARDLAEIELKLVGQLPDEEGTDQQSRRAMAKVKYQSEVRKAELLRKVAEATLHALDAELNQLSAAYTKTKSLSEKGYLDEATLEMERAKIVGVEANIQILEQIIKNK